jgi:phosphonate transport system substrate-binding protein
MVRRNSIAALIAILTLFANATGGSQSSKQAKDLQTLRMAFTPSHNPPALMEAAEPFSRALSDLAGVKISPLVSSDYVGVVEALRSKSVDLAFVHPVGYVLAAREAKARIIVKDVWHGKTTYTSRIYVRKDSNIKKPEDLRGKTIAFVDPASSSGYIYPMVSLVKKGLIKKRNPKTFFKEALFAGSHDAALLALVNRNVDAAASFDFALEQYVKSGASDLTYILETPPIPEAGVAVREGLTKEMVTRLKRALLAMNQEKYREILVKLYNIDGFEPAEDSDYDPVREAVALMGLGLPTR